MKVECSPGLWQTVGILTVMLALMGQVDKAEKGRKIEPEQALKRFEYTQPHMGTRFTILLYSDSESNARRAVDQAFARINQLNTILSDYDADSELSRFCDQAGQPPIKISQDFFQCLKRSQEVWRQTQGAFDVTAAPIIKLWRRARRTQTLPDPDRLKAAQALVGGQHLILNSQNQTAQLTKPGMRLDLGGIAKGYAADEALLTLKNHGHPRSLIIAGGDLRAGDPPPNQSGWEASIIKLGGEDQNQTLNDRYWLTNAAMSTSGDGSQFVIINNIRYSHIIDPRSAQPLKTRMAVTIIAPTATDSDALATAACVLGPDQGIAWINSFKSHKPFPPAVLYQIQDPQTQTIRFTSCQTFSQWPKLPKGFTTQNSDQRKQE